MPCYHPLIGLPVDGKTQYKLISCRDPGMFDYYKKSDPRSVLIPCGRCLGCRLDYSRSWADRMMLELETAGCGVFLTLTYDNDHIPVAMLDNDDLPLSYTLNKKDCQDFMKRLRKHFEPRRLRFYLAGEYGDHTFRPHYHAIIFGLSLDDFPDKVLSGKNELGQFYYFSDELQDIWENGFVLLCDVSWKTCAYVSRYVTKKVNGIDGKSLAWLNAAPEFALMSRKPGIGRFYLDQHPDCLDYTNINLSTPEGGLKIGIPKYFLKQLELTNPEKYDILRKERQMFADDRMILKLQKTGLSYLDYLEMMEQKKIDCVKTLKRNKVSS